jgi:hypothetical protein
MTVTGFKVGDLVTKRDPKNWYVGMLGVVIEIPSPKCSYIVWVDGESFLYLNSSLEQVNEV